MSVSTAEFWKLATDSRLFAGDAVEHLQARYEQDNGNAASSGVVALGRWLVEQGALTDYQATLLKAGRPGPFIYGHYLVHDRHRGGRLNRTFRARHIDTGHPVLLVFYSGAAASSVQQWQRLEEQMVQFSTIRHPHVCRVFQHVEDGSYKFTVMEDLEGESAAEHLKNGLLSWKEACRVVQQAALGAGAVLEAGQIHGALRPGNLWIDKYAAVKLLPPPLARDPLALDAPLAAPAVLLSALDEQADYLAPELGEPGRQPGPPTEVYALGCTLYFLVAGHPPFGGTDRVSKLREHAAGHAAPLEPGIVSAEDAAVLAQMMEVDPARRCQHPQLAADALGRLLEGSSIRVAVAPPPVTLAAFEDRLQESGTSQIQETADASDEQFVILADRPPQRRAQEPVEGDVISLPELLPEPVPMGFRRASGSEGPSIWFVLGMVLAVGVIIGLIVWNVAQRRNHQRQPTWSQVVPAAAIAGGDQVGGPLAGSDRRAGRTGLGTARL